MRPRKQNHYETLGVPRTAARGEIRRAYRKLARQCHPDLNPGDRLAEERFRNVQKAYHVLIDSQARQRYDQTAFKSERSSAETPAGTRGGADERRAAGTGSFPNGEWMDGEAASDAGVRYCYVPPREDKRAEAFQSLLVLLFTGNVILLISGKLVDCYGPPGHIWTLNLPSGLGLGGFSELVPLVFLFMVGWEFGGRRSSFLFGSVVINASFWGSLILCCRAAEILPWPDIKRMWPWVLPTHLVIMLGAKSRRGPMDWTRWGESGARGARG
jgi:hypothetical protein